jgi:hypothetical protein
MGILSQDMIEKCRIAFDKHDMNHNGELREADAIDAPEAPGSAQAANTAELSSGSRCRLHRSGGSQGDVPRTWHASKRS